MNNGNVLRTILGIIFLGAILVVATTVEEAFAPTSRRAPPAVTGDNVYVAWWTNNTFEQ